MSLPDEIIPITDKLSDTSYLAGCTDEEIESIVRKINFVKWRADKELNKRTQ